ncbi:MAG: FkbM family methyltransferase [Neomegalonema sp.]|nr:FkbM family methyltransferase [Neomegalonema sp.]
MKKALARHAQILRKRWLRLRSTFQWLGPRQAQYHGYAFDLWHPRMYPEARYSLLFGTYEAPEIDMIKRRLTPSDRVIEIGAGLGATSLVISGVVGCEQMRVYEADPKTKALAEHNFALNERPIDIRHAALWSGPDRPDAMQFYSSPRLSGSSLFKRSDEVEEVRTPTADLAEALSEFGATALVLDIEGGEIDLLGRAENLATVSTILMETHERVVGAEAHNGMLAHLRALGFEIDETIGKGLFLALTRRAPTAA